jgi:RND family efflux transporter MFP subunit
MWKINKVDRRNIVRIILWLLAIIIIALTARKVPNGKESEVAQPLVASLTVTQTDVKSALWPKIVSATGSIEPCNEGIIGSKISGEILVIHVDVGDSVSKGQVLAEFNHEIIEADYAEAKANLTEAELNLKRGMALKGSGAISAQELDNLTKLAEVAKARMDAQEIALKNMNIIAPEDGVISSRSAATGLVARSGDELFRIIIQNKIQWEGELTDKQLSMVYAGQEVSLTLPGGTISKAKIRNIAPMLDSKTRMAKIYADIMDGSVALAGMYVHGDIYVGEHKVLMVPSKSVVLNDGRSYVFVLPPQFVENESTKDAVDTKSKRVGEQYLSVDKDASIKHKINFPYIVETKRREVKAGQVVGSQIEILEGLDSGETVVVRGAGFLSDGDVVRVVNQED